MAERGAQLNRNAGDAIDVEVHGHDVVRARERLIGRRPIAEPGIDRHVIGHLVPDHRRARLHGVFRMVDSGQQLVVDLDRFRGIERLRDGFGHDHRHRLADMARLVGRQQQVRADEDRPAAGTGELHVVSGLGQRIVRDGAEAVGQAIGAGEHAEHARHYFGARRIHAADAGMRVRGADHHRMSLAVEVKIVAEAAVAGDEPLVLLAGHRLADGAEARLVHFHGRLGGVGHRSDEVATMAGCFIGWRVTAARVRPGSARETPSFRVQIQIYVTRRRRRDRATAAE